MNNIYRRHTSFEMLNNTILVICIQHDFQKVHEQEKAELSLHLILWQNLYYKQLIHVVFGITQFFLLAYYVSEYYQ